MYCWSLHTYSLEGKSSAGPQTSKRGFYRYVSIEWKYKENTRPLLNGACKSIRNDTANEYSVFFSPWSLRVMSAPMFLFQYEMSKQVKQVVSHGRKGLS